MFQKTGSMCLADLKGTLDIKSYYCQAADQIEIHSVQ